MFKCQSWYRTIYLDTCFSIELPFLCLSKPKIKTYVVKMKLCLIWNEMQKFWIQEKLGYLLRVDSLLKNKVWHHDWQLEFCSKLGRQPHESQHQNTKVYWLWFSERERNIFTTFILSNNEMKPQFNPTLQSLLLSNPNVSLNRRRSIKSEVYFIHSFHLPLWHFLSPGVPIVPLFSEVIYESNNAHPAQVSIFSLCVVV